MNLCKDCIHYLASTSEAASPKCTNHIDVVTGRKSETSCYAERSEKPNEYGDATCGPTGQFFQPTAEALNRYIHSRQEPSLDILTSQQVAFIDAQNDSMRKVQT